MRKITVLAISLLLWTTGTSLGYWADYPPYRFKDGPPSHLNAKPLVSGEGDYKSKDGSVVIHLKETKPFEVEFSLKIGNTTLVSSDQNMESFPSVVYQVDLDGNDRDDYIVFYNYRGTGLTLCLDRVEIYLRKNNGTFKKIAYDTFNAGLEDFIGPDEKDRYKVIVTGFYEGSDRHNYFTYHIFEFRNYKLVNADSKIKGFPKRILYTFRKNDRDARHK